MFSCSPQYIDIITTTKGTKIGKMFKKNNELIIYYQYKHKGHKIIGSDPNLKIQTDNISRPKLYITEKIGEREKAKDVVLEMSYILFIPQNYKFDEK